MPYPPGAEKSMPTGSSLASHSGGFVSRNSLLTQFVAIVRLVKLIPFAVGAAGLVVVAVGLALLCILLLVENESQNKQNLLSKMKITPCKYKYAGSNSLKNY